MRLILGIAVKLCQGNAKLGAAMTQIMTNVHHPRFQKFVEQLETLVTSSTSESTILEKGQAHLRDLIDADDWLPAEYSVPNPSQYTQYLLHLDPRERFSIVSFVWGPGQGTPIHNHTVWGILGVLRGAEKAQKYVNAGDGSLHPQGEQELLAHRQVDAVSPSVGDVHAVSNAFDDRVSISIHAYGGNIGKINRSVFRPDGSTKLFISGYANA
jgi:predicted metal-dependent enzyme (double-stranded beta helix superfamily)